MLVPAIALALAASSFGCGDDNDGNDDAPGPGASRIAGDVSAIDDAGGVSGIVVSAQGDGDDPTNITDSTGSFLLSTAPTGDVNVSFNRGNCNASFVLGAVVSSSSITLSDVAVDCIAPATATPASISETFQGVIRNNPGANVQLCVRVGSDDRNRESIAISGATQIRDQNNNTIVLGDLEDNDLVELTGSRTATGTVFTYNATSIRIVDRDIEDVCDDVPLN